MPDFCLIIPVDLKPKPDRYESAVARICAQHFQSDIKFVLRGNLTTPDILVVRTGELWEIKNIRGCGKHTIEDNMRKASKQSDKVVISLLAAPKLDAMRVKGRIISVLRTKRMPIQSVILITKTGKVIDIK